MMLRAEARRDSLGEKEISRAQNEKSKEYFSVVWRACRAVAGLPARQSFSVGGASLAGVLLKECSNFVQKTPPVILCAFFCSLGII